MVKVNIYFKKEFELRDEKDIERLGEFIKQVIKEKMFDEYYIFVNRDISEIEGKKYELLLSEVKEIKYIKSEIAHLKLLFRKVMTIVHELRDIIYKRIKVME